VATPARADALDAIANELPSIAQDATEDQGGGVVAEGPWHSPRSDATVSTAAPSPGAVAAPAIPAGAGLQAAPPGATIADALSLWQCFGRPGHELNLDAMLHEEALSVLQFSHIESERRRPMAAAGHKHLGALERKQVVTWLFQVCHAMNLHDSVLYMTVLVLDRFFALNPVQEDRLQQIVVSILCTSMKVTGGCDDSTKRRRLREHLEHLCQQNFSVEEILEVELEVLNALSFNVTTPTALDFLDAFVVPFIAPGTSEAFSPVWCLAKFLLQLSLLDPQLHYRYPHAVLASGAVYVALWCSQADTARVTALLQDASSIIGKYPAAGHGLEGEAETAGGHRAGADSRQDRTP